MSNTEKLYKLYNVKKINSTVGSIEKCECTINGEYGLFKEKLRFGSIDNVMEEVAYHIACIVGVPCAYARCRKHDGIIGSFSRYEIPDGCEFTHLTRFYNNDIEVHVTDLLSHMMSIESRYQSPGLADRLFSYIIFDYIMGQLDRHLENLAVLLGKSKRLELYKLYDNGLCCFSADANSNALIRLHNRFYSSRIGDSDEILGAIKQFKRFRGIDGLDNLVRYSKLNTSILYSILDASDKYSQIQEKRRKATAQFIMCNIEDLKSIDNR